MIDDTTTATTNEICKLAAITKQHLGRLEANGIVRRLGRDAWPLVATMNSLLTDARQRSDAHSQARARLDDLKAQREKLKLMKECREVCRVSEFEEFCLSVYGAHVKHYGSLAARIGGRDLAVRRLAQKELDIAQQGLSDEMMRLGEALKEGKSP
jgi:hypothetical protein